MKVPGSQPEGRTGVAGLPPAPPLRFRAHALHSILLPLCILGLLCFFAPVAARAQSAAAADPKAVWEAVDHPSYDTTKIFAVKNLVLQRDRIRVFLDEGTLQFMQPAGGVYFG